MSTELAISPMGQVAKDFDPTQIAVVREWVKQAGRGDQERAATAA